VGAAWVLTLRQEQKWDEGTHSRRGARLAARTIRMSFAILGLGTAVPPASITQADAANIARAVCCRTKEQETWLPLMYDHTGIQSRHLALGQPVTDDLLHATPF